MFERDTETARSVIFSARFEAGRFGSKVRLSTDQSATVRKRLQVRFRIPPRQPQSS